MLPLLMLFVRLELQLMTVWMVGGHDYHMLAELSVHLALLVRLLEPRNGLSVSLEGQGGLGQGAFTKLPI